MNRGTTVSPTPDYKRRREVAATAVITLVVVGGYWACLGTLILLTHLGWYAR